MCWLPEEKTEHTFSEGHTINLLRRPRHKTVVIEHRIRQKRESVVLQLRHPQPPGIWSVVFSKLRGVTKVVCR
jgi:hypothetical protein